MNCLTLCCWVRVMDHKVLLEIDLRDPSRKGSCVRFAHHLHPRETAGGSGRRYGDHPVPVSRRLSQRSPSLQPWPCKGRHQRWGWGWLSHVLCQFLGAGLVPRSLKEHWRAERYYEFLVTIITYYYILIHSYYYLLLQIHYYIIITSLLHHYYNCSLLLLRVITYPFLPVITWIHYWPLLHHYYVLLQTHYYSLLMVHYYIIITSLLHHYYIIITSLLQMAKLCNNEIIITHYYICNFHYYSVITHYYHYYSLLRICDRATCRWISFVLEGYMRSVHGI